MKVEDSKVGRAVRFACGCEATRAGQTADGKLTFWIDRRCNTHYGEQQGEMREMRLAEPDEEVSHV